MSNSAIDEMIFEHQQNIEKVKRPEYLQWIAKTVQEYDQFSDDDWLYNADPEKQELRENSVLLGYFFSLLSDIGETEETDLGERLYFQWKDLTFQMDQIFYQESCTTIRRVNPEEIKGYLIRLEEA